MKTEWFKIIISYTTSTAFPDLEYATVYKWREGDNTSDLIISAKEAFHEDFPNETITSIKSYIIKKSF